MVANSHYCGLLPMLVTEGNAELLWKISENQDVTFFPIQIHWSSEFHSQIKILCFEAVLLTSAMIGYQTPSRNSGWSLIVGNQLFAIRIKV